MEASVLDGKRILAVDDEADVLETLEDLLDEYPGLILDTARDYETGYHLLRSWTYDVVILDIMGVRGFDLLSAAVHLGFPTVMLTAHALSVEALKQSIDLGARAYIPKEKMADISEFLEDVLSMHHSGSLQKMFQRLGGFFNNQFGSQWMESETDYWDQVRSGQYKPKPVILKK